MLPTSQFHISRCLRWRGHKGQLVFGEMGGKQVVAMQGRFHYYEGYSMAQITFPVRVMKQLGVETIIVTNACGALNETFKPGIFMFIKDHINLTGNNPLIGKNLQDYGPRFPDMSSAYDKQLIRLGLEIAQRLEIEVATGIHTAVSGPNFLSKAELNMIKKMGSDTIGMSTIPEVIVAVHSGLKVLGISCVTDMAVPEQLEPIDHEKVMEMAAQSKPNFIRLVFGNYPQNGYRMINLCPNKMAWFFWTVLFTCLLQLGLWAQTGSSGPAGPPNILVIMADDLGAWATETYGNKEAKTPHLQRLAEHGAKFNFAFTVSPVCSPSRASFFTGRLPSQHGVHDFISETPEFDKTWLKKRNLASRSPTG